MESNFITYVIILVLLIIFFQKKHEGFEIHYGGFRGHDNPGHNSRYTGQDIVPKIYVKPRV